MERAEAPRDISGVGVRLGAVTKTGGGVFRVSLQKPPAERPAPPEGDAGADRPAGPDPHP
jgi:hypothetical protein